MVSNHSGPIPMCSQALLPCEATTCSRCSTWAPCGDHCYDLYQCPSFQYAWFALEALTHRSQNLFARCFHSRLVLVVSNIDTHVGGVLRSLVVGRLSWSPVGVRKNQRYGGNSADEGAIESSPSRVCSENFANQVFMPQAVIVNLKIEDQPSASLQFNTSLSSHFDV